MFFVFCGDFYSIRKRNPVVIFQPNIATFILNDFEVLVIFNAIFCHSLKNSRYSVLAHYNNFFLCNFFFAFHDNFFTLVKGVCFCCPIIPLFLWLYIKCSYDINSVLLYIITYNFSQLYHLFLSIQAFYIISSTQALGGQVPAMILSLNSNFSNIFFFSENTNKR